MPRIYVVSTVRGAESVVRQLLCEPVIGVSCQGTRHNNTLTSVTTCVAAGTVHVFDVKSCPTLLLDGGLIRLFQSVELVKVFHDVSIDSKLLHTQGINIRNYFDTQVGYSVLLEQKGLPPRKITLPQLCRKNQINLPAPDPQEQRKAADDVNYWAMRPMSRPMLTMCATSVMALQDLYTCLVSQLDTHMWEWFDCMSEENRLSRIQHARIRTVRSSRRTEQFLKHLYDHPVTRLTGEERQLLSDTFPETFYT